MCRRLLRSLMYMIPVLSFSFIGCIFFEDPSFQITCDSDEDLSIEQNGLDGAICVDGLPACPDGRDLCPYFEVFEGRDVIVHGCLKKCIDCPAGKGLCYHRNTAPQEPTYFCVDKISDCFGNWTYRDLPGALDGCPTGAKDCMAGSD